jgi:hypothetical protein
MIVLDTLSGDGDTDKVGERWSRLLTNHSVSDEDAAISYALRNSLLHGYGPPKREKLATGRCSSPMTETGMRSTPAPMASPS